MAPSHLPLHQISAFEAAMRHLSFSRAAQELNVQQPAVGRQVAALESDLGVKLFHRTKPRLTLTEDGEFLASAVTKGFDALRTGIAELRARQTNAGIVVNAAIGFTSFYLLPRLAEFQTAHPDIPVQVVTRDQNPDYDPSRCDVVVVFGTQGLSGAPSGLIVPETIVAVCRNGFLPDGPPLSLDKLAKQRLLHLAGASHVEDWNRYFEGTGITVPSPPQHDRYHSYMVYMRAIRNSMGIGIGWRPLIDEYLTDGTLVLACEQHRRTKRGYFCSLTPRGTARPEAAHFLSWLSTGDVAPAR